VIVLDVTLPRGAKGMLLDLFGEPARDSLCIPYPEVKKLHQLMVAQLHLYPELQAQISQSNLVFSFHAVEKILSSANFLNRGFRHLPASSTGGK
jgi:hypothetical protein